MFGHDASFLTAQNSEAFARATAKAIAHGLSQAAIAKMRYGSAKGVFLSGFIASGFSVGNRGYGNAMSRTMIMAVVGGGKFANGALTAAFVHMFNDENLGKQIKTYFVAFSANITAAFGGEVTVGYYWTNTGENGTFVSVGGTVGIDMGVDAVKGELYGDPDLLDGWFISSSGSIGYIGGGVITDISGNNQIGYFGGVSYSALLDAGYHQTVGYGWHSRNIPIYESVDNRVTVPSGGF